MTNEMKRLQDSMLTPMFGRETCTVNIDDLKKTLSLIDKYKSEIKTARDKAQILASHCAYRLDSGKGLQVEDTFIKAQEVYEVLRDILEKE